MGELMAKKSMENKELPHFGRKRKKLLYFDCLGNFLKFTQLIPLILISQAAILMVGELETSSWAQR